MHAVPDWIKQILAYVFGGKPSKMLVAPSLFAHLKRRGMPVWFLGVNDEVTATLAVNVGATAVLTDRIHWLTNILHINKDTHKFDEIPH